MIQRIEFWVPLDKSLEIILGPFGPFGLLWSLSDFFGPFRTFLDLFGPYRTLSDTYRTFPDLFGPF